MTFANASPLASLTSWAMDRTFSTTGSSPRVLSHRAAGVPTSSSFRKSFSETVGEATPPKATDSLSSLPSRPVRVIVFLAVFAVRMRSGRVTVPVFSYAACESPRRADEARTGSTAERVSLPKSELTLVS